MIAIIDYGMGNLGSISNMLKKINVENCITSDYLLIKQADKLILPGVGAFDQAMQNLTSLKLIPLLDQLVIKKHKPILGVCLGMQLFTKSSEEGSLAGLGWLEAGTIKFSFPKNAHTFRIPHMGWNTITVNRQTPLLNKLDNDSRFYFVHSFHVHCNDASDAIATTTYGIDFTSIVQHGNIYGAQFHPEKSHRFGMQLLKNFAQYA